MTKARVPFGANALVEDKDATYLRLERKGDKLTQERLVSGPLGSFKIAYTFTHDGAKDMLEQLKAEGTITFAKQPPLGRARRR